MDKETLTKREIQALSFAASGMKAREIANYMCLSEKTVTAHLAHGREKLTARNTTNAVAIAIRRGIIAGISMVIAISGAITDNTAIRTNTRTTTRISRTNRKES